MELVQITSPTTLYLAQEVKKDLEAKSCKVYITVLPTRNYRGGTRIVWREPDKEDRENGIKIKKVEVG